MKTWKVRISSDLKRVPAKKAVFEGPHDEVMAVARRRARTFLGTAEVFMPPHQDGTRLLKVVIDRDGTEREMRVF